jgi:hypothetical protein
LLPLVPYVIVTVEVVKANFGAIEGIPVGEEREIALVLFDEQPEPRLVRELAFTWASASCDPKALLMCEPFLLNRLDAVHPYV